MGENVNQHELYLREKERERERAREMKRRKGWICYLRARESGWIDELCGRRQI